MNPCPGNWVAIQHMAVYYAHAFSAEIKCLHCIKSSWHIVHFKYILTSPLLYKRFVLSISDSILVHYYIKFTAMTDSLVSGDQVLEWNGVCLTGKTFEEVQRIISQQNGEIELVIRP